jgi:hypothetical protein
MEQLCPQLLVDIVPGGDKILMSGWIMTRALGGAGRCNNTFGSTATYCMALYHYISVWNNSGCLSFLLRVRFLPALFTFVLQRLMQRDRKEPHASGPSLRFVYLRYIVGVSMLGNSRASTYCTVPNAERLNSAVKGSNVQGQARARSQFNDRSLVSAPFSLVFQRC